MPLPLAAPGHRGLLRVPRAVSRGGGMGRRALDDAGIVAARRRGRRGLDARRMGAQRRVHGLPVALARLRGAGRRPPGARWPGTRPSAAYSWSRSRSLPWPRRSRCSSMPSLPRRATRAALLLAAIAAVLAGGAALARVEWTAPVRRAGRRVARAGQRHAGAEVRPRFPPRRPSTSTSGSWPRVAGGSSCCRRARSRCSRTRCPRACCSRCGTSWRRATATRWSACSPSSRRSPRAAGCGTTTAS